VSNKLQKGLTLMELLMVMAIMGVLFSVIIVSLNPAKQLARARDTKRESDLFAILSSVYEYTSEHSGALPDTDGDPATSNFPTSPTCIGSGGGCFDLANAGEDDDTMVPEYMAGVPKDPKTGTDADTGYLIFVDANERLIASASGETREISVTR
jgi:prepilin-type N-terminal cleavage/methylation domain-containing protein